MYKETRWGYDCTCERCGHTWETRSSWYSSQKNQLPKSCAKCKSKGWNKPRVYAGKYTEATILKREKPTGRKAKKNAGSSSD